MRLFRKKQSPPPPDREISNKIQRPKPYRYHAVRSTSTRSTTRGEFDVNKTRDSPLEKTERIITFAVISVIVISMLYAFWLDSVPSVHFNEKNSPGASILLRELPDYQKGAQEILSASLFSRTKLTLDTNKFSKDLIARFPELATVTVTIPLAAHQPIIDIQVKEPKLLVETNGTTVVVDQDGFVVARLNEVSKEAQEQLTSLARIDDTSGLEAENGQRILTSESVDFILQLQHQYNQAKRIPSKLQLSADTQNEIQVSEVGQNYIVKYIVSRSADEQFGTYIAVSEKLHSEGRQPAEYIDVRVEGKAFYK